MLKRYRVTNFFRGKILFHFHLECIASLSESQFPFEALRPVAQGGPLGNSGTLALPPDPLRELIQYHTGIALHHSLV